MAGDRWATFDCYGTLIDWNGGIRGELARVFGEERADALLERYHVLEPQLEADGSRSYREVLTEAMRGLGAPEEEADALAHSLPHWQPFPEVPAGAQRGARPRLEARDPLEHRSATSSRPRSRSSACRSS